MQGDKLRSDKEFRSNAKHKASSNIGTRKNVCNNEVKCGRYNYERRWSEKKWGRYIS